MGWPASVGRRAVPTRDDLSGANFPAGVRVGVVLAPHDQLSPGRLRITLVTDQATSTGTSTQASSAPPPPAITPAAIP